MTFQIFGGKILQVNPWPATITLSLFAVLIGCGRAKATPYENAIESGKTSIPCIKEFEALFPKVTHVISYYTGEQGVPTWTSKVGIYGRYILTAQIEIKFDEKREKVKDWGKPTFVLDEIDKVSWDENTRTETINPGEVHLIFGPDKWEKLVEAKGDFKSLGVVLKKDRPVTGFEEHLRRG